MLLDKVKLQQYEPFARQHSDSLDTGDDFVLIADERRFVWVCDKKTGKDWGVPFEAVRNWLRSKEQVTLELAERVPIALRQARLKERAVIEHHFDDPQLHENKGYEMHIDGTSVYVLDKARNREIPLVLEDLEYFEIWAGQVEQVQPLQDAVRPLTKAAPKKKKEAPVVNAG